MVAYQFLESTTIYHTQSSFSLLFAMHSSIHFVCFVIFERPICSLRSSLQIMAAAAAAAAPIMPPDLYRKIFIICRVSPSGIGSLLRWIASTLPLAWAAFAAAHPWARRHVVPLPPPPPTPPDIPAPSTPLSLSPLRVSSTTSSPHKRSGDDTSSSSPKKLRFASTSSTTTTPPLSIHHLNPPPASIQASQFPLFSSPLFGVPPPSSFLPSPPFVFNPFVLSPPPMTKDEIGFQDGAWEVASKYIAKAEINSVARIKMMNDMASLLSSNSEQARFMTAFIEILPPPFSPPSTRNLFFDPKVPVISPTIASDASSSLHCCCFF